MKKYRIEFNISGFFTGAGVWETLDEFCGLEAENEKEAIRLAKEWWAADGDKTEEELSDYCWRASEEGLEDDYGFPDYKWIYEED